MNRYILIRRLTWPAILILAGVVALLHEADLVDFWKLFWPLLLILIGVLKLAQRAALAAAEDEAFYPGTYTGYPYGTAPAPGIQPPAPASDSATGTSIVPVAQEPIEKVQGGQS